jgi:hypothetical protein
MQGSTGGHEARDRDRLGSAADAARAAWGLLLLVAPGAVLRGAGVRETRPARAVLRILGARHAAQAAVTAWAPRRPVLRAGAVLDGLHGASAVLLAAADRGRRRAGVLDAGVAAGFGALGLVRAGRRSPSRARARRADRPNRA